MFPGDINKMSLFFKIKFIVMNFYVKIAYARFHPTVIAATGSMSKSTTVNFIYQLANYFNPGKVKTNLFLGTLTSGARHQVLDLRNSKGSKWNSFKNFFIAFKIFFIRNFPKFFVFEFRSQRRGRIEFASSSLKPKIGVFMWVAPAHSDYFGDLDKIYEEKLALIKSLPSDGAAILNYDDERVRRAKDVSRAKVIYFGLDKAADIWADEISADLSGLVAHIHYRDKDYLFNSPNIINRNHIYPVLASLAVMISLGYPLEKSISAFQNIEPLDRRSNIEKGINNSKLINETFNANPKSVKGALEMLADVAGQNRKIAVLGDMLEQGKYMESGHKEVGEIAAKKVDELILVGEHSKIIGESAQKKGFAKEKNSLV